MTLMVKLLPSKHCYICVNIGGILTVVLLSEKCQVNRPFPIRYTKHETISSRKSVSLPFISNPFSVEMNLDYKSEFYLL